MKLAFRRWVEFWDARERADSLAVVRILLSLALLYDLAEVVHFDLVDVFWAPVEDGGLGPASYADPIIAFYRWFGASRATAHALFALTFGSALTLALGLFSRTSALVLLLSYAQLEPLSPDADRGIDTLIRDILVILVLSRAGGTFSLDARIRRGSFVSDELFPAWPRYLIIAQMVIMYFFAGLSKSSFNWSWGSGYIALFYVLHQPHFARFMIPHDLLAAGYRVVQLGAASTLVWERSALLLPVLLWLRATRARDTPWHRWANRLHLLELWAGIGIFFHLSLALLLTLGIFPWGCIALYAALVPPDTMQRRLRRAAELLRARLAPRRAPTS